MIPLFRVPLRLVILVLSGKALIFQFRYLSATSYKGLLSDQARTISLMQSVDSGGPLLTWGDNLNRWEFSWD